MSLFYGGPYYPYSLGTGLPGFLSDSRLKYKILTPIKWKIWLQDLHMCRGRRALSNISHHLSPPWFLRVSHWTQNSRIQLNWLGPLVGWILLSLPLQCWECRLRLPHPTETPLMPLQPCADRSPSQLPSSSDILRVTSHFNIPRASFEFIKHHMNFLHKKMKTDTLSRGFLSPLYKKDNTKDIQVEKDFQLLFEETLLKNQDQVPWTSGPCLPLDPLGSCVETLPLHGFRIFLETWATWTNMKATLPSHKKLTVCVCLDKLTRYPGTMLVDTHLRDHYWTREPRVWLTGFPTLLSRVLIVSTQLSWTLCVCPFLICARGYRERCWLEG